MSCLSFQHRAYRLPLRIKTTKKKERKKGKLWHQSKQNNNKGSGDCKTRNQCVVTLVYSKLFLFRLEMVIYQAHVLPYPVTFFFHFAYMGISTNSEHKVCTRTEPTLSSFTLFCTVSERTLLPTIHYFSSLLPPYSVWKDPPPYHPLLPSFPLQHLKGPSSLPSITSLPSFPHSVWKWKDPPPYHPFLLHFPPSPIVSESERTLLPTIHFFFTSLLPP